MVIGRKIFVKIFFFLLPCLCLGDPLPCHHHVENRNLLDIIHCLLMRDHGEVIPTELEYLVMHPQTSLASSTIRDYVCHIDTIV